MLARTLAEPYPVVSLDTPAQDAARLLSERKLPGLVVVDHHDHPVAILPGSQLLRRIIPAYIQDDPALARVLDEASADRLCDAIADKTVDEILPEDRRRLPVVAADDTAMEIAALMAREHSPIVAVVEERSKKASMIGVVTASHLLELLLPAKG